MTLLRFVLIATAGALLLLTMAVVENRSYYALESEERPAHEAHAVLRSSGDFGLTCGLAGSALILLNLTYLLRKWLAHVSWMGNFRTWMGLHVATGLVGSGLILVHSAFHVRSAPGQLAVTCLGIVVCTGLIGRYFFSLVPRSLAGKELERADLRRRFEEHRAALAARNVELPAIDADRTQDISVGGSFLSRLTGVLAGDRKMRGEYRALKVRILANEGLRAHADDILPVARKYCREAQWLSRYSDLRGLMGSWRFLHRWLAIVMLVIVVFHVAIALQYGDLSWPSRVLP